MRPPQSTPPKRIAVVTTVYRYLSHAQHIADRFLVGYPVNGKWHRPDMKIVSLYVDQKPEGDQSVERAQEFGFQVYPTIAEVLRCGGEKLAVDAVFNAMRVSMQRGDRIELRGFGVFQVKPRKRGIGRNPRTGKEVKIPPGRTIRFKPGKELQNLGG